MGPKARSFRPIPFFCVAALALSAAGCSTFTGGGGGGSEPATTAATTTAPQEGEIDVRRYLGPNYCPELRILEGKQLVREYERGRQDDPAGVIWQASIGKTARECLYDLQNNLTLRVGVSGRVIAGPKGGAGAVSVPLRIGVVKFKEKVLFSELYSIPVTIPAQGSTAFTDVREVTVPSPGTARDYILYIALGEQERDWMNPIAEEPAPVVAAVDEPIAALEEAAAPPPPPPAAAPPPQPTTPRELPTPTGGFVLGR